MNYANKVSPINPPESSYIPKPPTQNLQYATESWLSESSRHNLKVELLKGLEDKFEGKSSTFCTWYGYINERIIDANIISMDIMYVLKANTRNRPNKLISDYLNAGVTNPSHINADMVYLEEKIWFRFPSLL